MIEFMKILLSLSVSGTLLLLLILLLKRLYQNKFSRRWQYYIWIIAALRFLLPFTPDTTIVGSLFENFNTAAAAKEASADSSTFVSAREDSGKAEPTEANKNMMNIIMHDPSHIYACLFFIWSASALALLVRKITVYQSFVQYIEAGNTEVSDIKILNLLSDCKEKLKIKTSVEVSRHSLIASPIMIGFFRPKIVLPACELEEKELSCIFMHELIHYRQRDIFYKWLIQIVVCLHWFNPFVCLLEKEVNKACELSCDEKVISILGDRARREYGDTLIFFLRSDNPCKSSPASITLTEGAEQLKERLSAIMNFRKMTKLMTVVSLLTAFLLSMGGFAIGAYSVHSIPHEGKTDVTGHITAQENISGIKETISIVHESAEILYYEDGSPYIHDILTNNTDTRIVETEYCMLAYNKNGLPLKLHWNFLDNGTESSYENLVRTETSILPDQTEDYHGGWSLYDGDLTESLPKTENGEVDQVGYSLYCLKQVVFEDGTVWDNPDYENWFKAYAGKETDVEKLQSYYPHQYPIPSKIDKLSY